jgi:hypothetical protein
VRGDRWGEAMTKLERRALNLEAALKPFAELPQTDNVGNPIVDLHVNYAGGAGWSMKYGSNLCAAAAIKRARSMLGDKPVKRREP